MSKFKGLYLKKKCKYGTAKHLYRSNHKDITTVGKK